MPPHVDSSVHIAELFAPEIKELLADKNFKEVKELLRSIPRIDLADAWDRFTPAEQALLFRLLPARHATTLFQELEPDEQSHILESLGDDELQGLLGDV